MFTVMICQLYITYSKRAISTKGQNWDMEPLSPDWSDSLQEGLSSLLVFFTKEKLLTVGFQPRHFKWANFSNTI